MTEHEAHNIVLAWRWLLSTWAKEHPVAAEADTGRDTVRSSVCASDVAERSHCVTNCTVSVSD